MGQLHENSFRFPVTQEELGQAVGFSAVHVNRVLQRLRADGLITYEGGRLTIHDRERLARAGDFDPSYLYLSGSDPDRGPPEG